MRTGSKGAQTSQPHVWGRGRLFEEVEPEDQLDAQSGGWRETGRQGGERTGLLEVTAVAKVRSLDYCVAPAPSLDEGPSAFDTGIDLCGMTIGRTNTTAFSNPPFLVPRWSCVPPRHLEDLATVISRK